MKLTVLILAILILTIPFEGTAQKEKNLLNTKIISSDTNVIVEINCDTIYPNKNYKILLFDLDPEKIYVGNDEIKNTVFQLRKQNVIIFTDSIYSNEQDVEFGDFNGDKIKDILIRQESSARSNWNYYLYIVDTLSNTLKKIKNFEQIPNPNYLPKYDLIDNYVLTGVNWTGFYKIQNDTIYDFGITIEDNQTDNKYLKAYKKSIKQIMKKLKK